MGKRQRPRKILRCILPSVTSPKEEKASLSDFSSTDHDSPERTSESLKKQIRSKIEESRERERERGTSNKELVR